MIESLSLAIGSGAMTFNKEINDQSDTFKLPAVLQSSALSTSTSLSPTCPPSSLINDHTHQFSNHHVYHRISSRPLPPPHPILLSPPLHRLPPLNSNFPNQHSNSHTAPSPSAKTLQPRRPPRLLQIKSCPASTHRAPGLRGTSQRH